MFAKAIKNANIKEHEKVVLESKDPKYNYMFALGIKDANIKEHEKVILESKDLEYNYKFAKTIIGAYVLAHSKILLENNYELYNENKKNIDEIDKILYKNMKMDSDIKKIDKLLLTLQNKNE